MKKKLSVSALLKAIPACQGNLAAVARRFGVTRAAVWEYIKRHSELHEALADAKEAMLDYAETGIHKQIAENNLKACIFYLRMQGKSRGYGNRDPLADMPAGLSKTQQLDWIQARMNELMKHMERIERGAQDDA